MAIDQSANFSWTGTHNFDEVKIDTTTCLDSNGADRLFHDTDCDAVKDSNEQYIDQAGLDDANCTNGQIYKKSGGTWVCSTDISGDSAGEPNGLYVCWDGTDQSIASGGGTIVAPFKTIQYAINRATELGNPDDYALFLCAGTWPSGNETYPVKTYNTDSGSAAYQKQAQGLQIFGAPTTLAADGAVFDMTGATNFGIRDVVLNAYTSVYSNGGTYLASFDAVGFNGVGQLPRLQVRGMGNNSNWFGAGSNYFTLSGTFGTAILYEIGGSTGNGVCNGSALPFGTCASATDCGGICNASSTPDAAIAGFCAANEDCGAGTCVFSPTCSVNSLDKMHINTFHQSAGMNYAQLLPRTCEGGATTPSVTTVAIDHDDTCSASTCATLAVACATNTDCRRTVKGTGTSFTTDVDVGDAVTIGSKRATVEKIVSNTLMRVTAPWANSTGTSYTVSDDGTVCDSNADCATTGICTEGTGSTFEEHFNNAVMLSAGEAGMCGDGAGQINWPRLDCSTRENYCQDTTSCTADADCAAGGQPRCNKITGKCSTYNQCTTNGDCTGTSGCTGGESCTCADECNGGGCVNASVYVEGSGNSIRLRDATLTTTNNLETTYDYPENQVLAVDGASVKIQGGSFETTPASACTGSGTPYSWCTGAGAGKIPTSTVLKETGGTVEADAVLAARNVLVDQGMSFTPTTLLTCAASIEGETQYDTSTSTLCVCTNASGGYLWCPVGNPDCTSGQGASTTACGITQGFGTGDYEASNEGNYLGVKDDDDAAGTAFDGTAGTLTVGDIDESATDKWCFYDSTTKSMCLPAPSSTATQALFATATSGEPAFRAIADADIPDAHAHDSSATGALASANDDDTSLATTSFVQQEINGSGGVGLTASSGSLAIDKMCFKRGFTLFNATNIQSTPMYVDAGGLAGTSAPASSSTMSTATTVGMLKCSHVVDFSSGKDMTAVIRRLYNCASGSDGGGLTAACSQEDTSVTCTITGDGSAPHNEYSCTDSTHSASFSAGDRFQIKFSSTAVDAEVTSYACDWIECIAASDIGTTLLP